MSKKVSIIIPVFNSEKYLGRCLNSVIQQTYSNLEVIMVNDGSTDNSKKICRDFSNRDLRLKLITTLNNGPSHARNIGLKEATGDFVIFVDSDDFLELDVIEKCVSILNETGAQMVIFGWNVYHEDTYIKSIRFDEYTNIDSDYVLSKMIISNDDFGGGYLWNRIIDINLLRNNNFPYFIEDINSYEDKVWLVEVLKRIKSVSIASFIGYNYIIHEGSLTRSSIKNIAFQRIDAFNRLSEMINGYRTEDKFCKLYADILLGATIDLIREKEFTLAQKIWLNNKMNVNKSKIGCKSLLKYLVITFWAKWKRIV